MILETLLGAKAAASVIVGSSLYKRRKGLYTVDMGTTDEKKPLNAFHGPAKLLFSADEQGAMIVVSGRDYYKHNILLRAHVALADGERRTITLLGDKAMAYRLETPVSAHDYWEKNGERHFTIAYKPTPQHMDRLDYYTYVENEARGLREGEHFFRSQKTGRDEGTRPFSPDMLDIHAEHMKPLARLACREAARVVAAFNDQQLSRRFGPSKIASSVIKRCGL